MIENTIFALLISLLAGLATAIGSLIGIAFKKPGDRFMSFTLGFSAGVMLLVSFVELLAKSIQSIGFWQAHFSFFAGMIMMIFIDFLIPHDYFGERHKTNKDEGKLLRTSLFIALGIGIHNFPEGLATFASSLKDLRLGISIAVAVGIHNIPEGIAVSAPVFAATGSRKKAFFWSFLSGISEPIAAIVAFLFLFPFLSESLLGFILSCVAGLMVFISLDELIPASRAYGFDHFPILGALLGMIVMVLSLGLLQ